MGLLGQLIERCHVHLEQHKHRPFLEAAMAACALVSTADGVVDECEVDRVDIILKTLQDLKVFDHTEGVELFRDFSDAILAAPKHGRALAWKPIARIAPDKEAVESIVRICLAVSRSHEELSLVDQIEIVSLCSRLGVVPENCGLYVDDDPRKTLFVDQD